MSTALTQYGTEDFQALLDAFSRVGKDILLGDIAEEVRAVNKKQLRKFKMKEACEMIGRSDSFLRKLEQEEPEYTPEKIGGVRYYDLSLINKIRDKAGTRYKRPRGSKPIRLAISNFKGGVGKSISAKNLGDKLALAGLKILLIGMDGQGTDALYYGYIPDLDIKPEETIRDALLKDPNLIKSLVKSTYIDTVDIIPGNLSLTQVEIKLTDYREQMTQVKRLGFPDERLANALELIEDQYDVILLDCGPNLNILTLNAINAANGILLPIPPALPDFASFGTYCKTLSEHLESSGKAKSLDFFRIFITKDPKNKSATKVGNLMHDHFGSYVMPRHVVYSAEIEAAASEFCSLYEMQPKSKATYKRAMDSLDGVFNEVFEAMQMVWEAQAQQEQDDE